MPLWKRHRQSEPPASMQPNCSPHGLNLSSAARLLAEYNPLAEGAISAVGARRSGGAEEWGRRGAEGRRRAAAAPTQAPERLGWRSGVRGRAPGLRGGLFAGRGGAGGTAVICRYTLSPRRGLPEGNRYCARKWSCSPRPWIE